MKRIPLTRGKFAIVDDDMYDYLNQWKWYAKKMGNGWYAVRGITTQAGQKHISMHRVIMENPFSEIDHRDRSTLNNQKSNLRTCSHVQNMANQGTRSTNKSGFKGVCWDYHANKWRAQLIYKGRKYYLGCYFCIIKAVKAYDRKAAELCGAFAYLNFPKA